MSFCSLHSKSLCTCVLVLALYARHCCCTSGSGYCETDGCPDDEYAKTVLAVDDQKYSVISYISGAVGSLLRPLKNAIKKALDSATEIAYKVWVVAIEELYRATKDYIPAVLTLLLLTLCLIVSYLMWWGQVRCRYICLFMSGTYVLYIIFGPGTIFAILWVFSRYCIFFMNAVAFSQTYRILLGVIILVVSLCLIWPCVRKSDEEDRLKCIERNITLLLARTSAIETLKENQYQMLQILMELQTEHVSNADQGRRSRSRRYHGRGTKVGSKTYESH